MLCFPGMVNPILTHHPQSDFKSKEKMSTITAVGFKTLKEYAKNGQLLKKIHLVFKIFISFLTIEIQLQLIW